MPLYTNLSHAEESEALAWSWLLSLRRLDDFARSRRQVIVTAEPGRLGGTSGAPLVSVSIDIGDPRRRRRIRGSGNDLATAVARLRRECNRAGVAVPDLPVELVWRG